MVATTEKISSIESTGGKKFFNICQFYVYAYSLLQAVWRLLCDCSLNQSKPMRCHRQKTSWQP